MTSTRTWKRAWSFLGAVVLVLATGPAGGQTVAEPPAAEERAILETAYPDYDATKQDVPLRWKTAPVPWFDPALAEATHVLLQVVATRAWGSSDILVLTALRYDSRTTEDGWTTRVVMESKAELLLVRRDGPVILSRADLGVLLPNKVDEQFTLPNVGSVMSTRGSSELYFDGARYDLNEREQAAGVRISENSRYSALRGWVYDGNERVLLFRVGPRGLEKVLDEVMLSKESAEECSAETNEEARDRCDCDSLKDVACMAENEETEKRVLIVSPGRTGGFFDLILRGTTEKHVGRRRVSLKTCPAVTYRWDGSRYGRAGA